MSIQTFCSFLSRGSCLVSVSCRSALCAPDTLPWAPSVPWLLARVSPPYEGDLGGLFVAVGHPEHCGLFHSVQLPLEASSTPICKNQNRPVGVRMDLGEKWL